jgi:hypothetical protein
MSAFMPISITFISAFDCLAKMLMPAIPFTKFMVCEAVTD